MKIDLEGFLQSKEFEIRWAMLDRATQSRWGALGKLALGCSVVAAALLTHMHAKQERHEHVSTVRAQLEASRVLLGKRKINEQRAEAAYANARSSLIVTRVKLQGLEARLRLEDRERDVRGDARSQLDQQIRSAETSLHDARRSYSLAKNTHDAFRDEFWETTDVAERVPGIEPYKAKVRQATAYLERSKQDLQGLVASSDKSVGEPSGLRKVS